METRTIHSELELETILSEDIARSDSTSVRIFAGHMPLIYDLENHTVGLEIGRWGDFSSHTFDLGCRLARFAKNKNKEASIIVMVDDIVEIPKEENGRRKVRRWMVTAQKRYYAKADLPSDYLQFLHQYGVEDTIISQERSFGSCKLVSEMKMKSDALQKRLVAPNECSLSIKAMLSNEKFFQPDDYFIGLIPGQCKGNICSGVLDVIPLNASHAFYPHIEIMGGIFDTGNGFVKAASGLKMEEIYKQGMVTYRRDSKP